mmetsp:Transcript_8797/g.37175  ORF Transcript_8797/g.37175 Transcript_8797/m.37175 type:complete len:206 (+) Transcript_8797:818-1435(+)
MVQPSLIHESVDADAGTGCLFAGDEHARQRRLELRFKLGELRKERRHQRDVAEAIGRAAAEKLIAVDCQAERVHFPSVGVGGDDVQVATNEAQHILGGAGAGILDDQVTSTFRVRHVFDLERTAVFLSVRREDLEAVLDGEIFLGDVRGAHARVLQVLHLTDEVAKQANEAFFVELESLQGGLNIRHRCLRCARVSSCGACTPLR